MKYACHEHKDRGYHTEADLDEIMTKDTAITVAQGILLITISTLFKDVDFEKKSTLHNKLERLCSAHSSVPEGYKVTCANGITIYYG